MEAAPTRPARTPRAEREFGLLVGGILVSLALWWLWRGKFAVLIPAFLGIGSMLVLLGALWPRALVWPLRGWMALAELLSRGATFVILAVVFFLVVTPIGLLQRLVGRDPLERRARPGDSQWRPYGERQSDPSHFEKSF